MLLVGIFLVVLLSSLLIFVLWEDRLTAKNNGPAGWLTGLWTGPERRCAKRIRMELPIHYEVMLSPVVVSGTWHSVSTQDVSEGGMCVRLYERLPAATHLKFKISLQYQEETIHGAGEVRWTSEELRSGARRTFRTGIQFLQIAPYDQERLLQFLKKPALTQKH